MPPAACSPTTSPSSFAVEAERHVGVADGADARRASRRMHCVGLSGRQDVLPDRVARAGVVEADRVAGSSSGSRLAQEVEGLLADVLAGPRRGDRRVAGEVGDVDARPSTTRSWLPARHRSQRSSRQLDALVGLGAVAHQVAEAPDRVHALALGVLQHGLEGRQVAVHVRDQGDPLRHRLGRLPSPATTVSWEWRRHRSRLPLAVLAAVVAAGAATLAPPPRSGSSSRPPVDGDSLLQPRAAGTGARLPRPPAAARAREPRARPAALLVLLAAGPPRRLLAAARPAAPARAPRRRAPGISLVLVVVGLPLAAVAHERAVDVGLSTQDWVRWLATSAKSAAIEAVFAAGRRRDRRWR